MDLSDRPGTAGLPPGALHARVCELRRRTRRRVFATGIELLSTADARPLAGCSLPAGERLDHALRVDLLVALLDGVAAADEGRVALLVTRPGPGPVDAADVGWLAAWTVACEVLGRPRGTASVVTRYGYADVLAGSWVRVEPRRHRR